MSSYFDWLPEELLIEIFIYCNSMENLIQVSPFSVLITKKSAWRNIFRLAFPEVDVLDVLNTRDDINHYLIAYHYSHYIYRSLFIYNFKNNSFSFTDTYERSLMQQPINLEKFIDQIRLYLSNEEVKQICTLRKSIKIFMCTKNGIHSINIVLPSSRESYTQRNINITKRQFLNLLFLRDYCLYL